MQKFKYIYDSISLEVLRAFFLITLGIVIVWGVNSMMELNWIGITAMLVLLIGIFVALVILSGKINKTNR